MGVDIQWGIGGGNNALALFGQGAQMGQQVAARREQREQQNALLDLRKQELDARLKGEEQARSDKTREQHQKDIPIMARLLDHATDEQTYQQARAAAASYGIDLTGVPANFDPAWVGQQKMLLQAIQTPDGMKAASNAGQRAIDLGYKPGTPEFAQVVHQLIEADLAKPYTGSQGETRLYTPQIGGQGQVQGGPQPGQVEDGYRFKGGNPADPTAWEPVAQGGGGASGVTAHFLDGL